MSLTWCFSIRRKIHENISLKTAAAIDHVIETNQNTMESAANQVQMSAQSKRPLVVLFTWLGAQERHIEKYQILWIEKGFDVLTVQTSPQEVLVPKAGPVPLSQDLIKILALISESKYHNILFHCFSVGAYQFGEFLHNLNDSQFMHQVAKMIGSSVNPKVTIENSIKGIIFDSPVDFDGIPEGISKAFSLNPIIQKPIELYIKAYMKLAYPIVTKYYIRALDRAHNNYLKAPGLFFSSLKDTIGTPEMSAKFSKDWQSCGIDVKEKVFTGSYHVQHMPKYKTEYQQEIDDFLKKVNFSTLK